jgi:hypothetical protein
MRRKKYTIILVIIGIMIAIPVICPISQGTATIVLSETFETVDEWKLQGFDFIDWETGCEWNPDFAPVVENGVLRMPNTQDGWHVSHAVHSSTIAYGTWSFDWYVNAGKDHQVYDIISFIVNNMGPTEQSGEIPENMTGYALVLIPGEKIISSQISRSVSLVIWRNDSVQWTTLNHYQFSDTLKGTYHIDITRNITGKFSVYFDGKLKFQVTDNSTTTSESFAFVSWYGDTTYDNLKISNTMDVTSQQADYPPLVIVIVSIGVVIILRKKGKT